MIDLFWLPGDGSVEAIRVDHELKRQYRQYGLKSQVNPFGFAREEVLLVAIAALEQAIEQRKTLDAQRNKQLHYARRGEPKK